MDNSVLHTLLTEQTTDLILLAKSLAASKIASGVFHELNQPLCGIRGFAELAQLQSKDQSNLNKYIAMIREQSDRLNQMLVDFRKLFDTSAEVSEKIDAALFVEDLLRWTNQQIKARGIVFEKKIASQSIHIKAVPSELRTLLLLSYAICRDRVSLLKEGKKRLISFELKRNDSLVEIQWTDSGDPAHKASYLDCLLCEAICQKIGGKFSMEYSPHGVVLHIQFPFQKD